MERKYISAVLRQNSIKHASNIHENVTASIGIIYKELLSMVTPYSFEFEPPNKNPPKQVNVISTAHHPRSSPETSPRDI